jgi:tetratricopeptide (TPR) repeat protein
MNWQQTSPQFSPDLAGRVVVLEAEPGQARDAVIQQWMADSRQNGAITWLLNCAYEEGGIWSGVADLFQELVPKIREHTPSLLTNHSYELCLILPTLRQQLPVRNPTLTEMVSQKEKTRNFAADRAYRSLHGLIDLLDAWHRVGEGEPWTIVCDQYDQANELVHRFFAELMRRRGQRLKLSLLVATAPGTGDAIANRFASSLVAHTTRLHLPSTPRPYLSKERASQLAHELEQRVEQDVLALEMYLPILIHYWEQSDTPDRALRWQITAMGLYNHLGLYEAALVYSAQVEARLEHLYETDSERYTRACDALFYCYLLLGEVERAQRVLEALMVRTVHTPRLPMIYYHMAMLYARYQQPPDPSKAEEYLQRGLTMLSDVDLPEGDRHFLIVFIWNGLAFVRLRQGRPQEALDLCHEGIARLNKYLHPEGHRLHRSVLLYNIAQVHAQIGPHEEALAYFTEAMAMDPNYSEYYNERGNVYMKMERFDEAERDYLTAIGLSPPYAEVWTNLGQCYRATGRMTEAAQAYSRAIDLEPKAMLALVGRADANAALDQPDMALVDYDAALALDPAQPLVLASRAILHYEGGRVLAALQDLDDAVALAPQTPELYQNRAVALRDVGRVQEAVRDLLMYLRLNPGAEDRREVEDLLSDLAAAPAATL